MLLDGLAEGELDVVDPLPQDAISIDSAIIARPGPRRDAERFTVERYPDLLRRLLGSREAPDQIKGDPDRLLHM
jgi:hypothetical protein